MFTNLMINREQKSLNSISILYSIKIMIVVSNYFADWSGFSSHSINGIWNRFESKIFSRAICSVNTLIGTIEKSLLSYKTRTLSQRSRRNFGGSRLWPWSQIFLQWVPACHPLVATRPQRLFIEPGHLPIVPFVLASVHMVRLLEPGHPIA